MPFVYLVANDSDTRLTEADLEVPCQGAQGMYAYFGKLLDL